MNSTVEAQAGLSRQSTALPKLSAADRVRIRRVIAELSGIDLRLAAVAGIKETIVAAGADFAAGTISVAEAVALLSVTDRQALQTALRAPLKLRARDLCESVRDIEVAAISARVDDLAAKARRVETSERSSAKTLGIGDDVFSPSETLRRVRESHRREAATLADARGGKSPVSRITIEALAAALPEPATELASDALDLERELASDFH